MKLENKVIFVSGANRGIGKSLVEALLKHRVQKIYAAARDTKNLPDFGDKRVENIQLDITNLEQINAAAAKAADVNLLINNAGALAYSSIIEGDIAGLKSDMEVNYFGTINLTRAFVPVIQQNAEGAIASIISVLGLAPMPGIGGYSASKAALFSAIQAMRAELKSKKIEVFGIFPGPIDTDMTKTMQMQKANPAIAAENILKSIEAGQEDIFPDPMSAEVSKLWLRDPKALERQFASY